MHCREFVERIVKECFTTYGGSCLDTPVFERKDILAGKYGEDAKLIFDLKDQGGEELALRYDHTVPLARYLAMNGAINAQAKLWQVGKVYRRDNPVMSKGRMREFTQAVSIPFIFGDKLHPYYATGFRYCWSMGHHDPGCRDRQLALHCPHETRGRRVRSKSKLILAFCSRIILPSIRQLNHRRILDGIFEVCGVPADKIRTISSAVDKLDKVSLSYFCMQVNRHDFGPCADVVGGCQGGDDCAERS